MKSTPTVRVWLSALFVHRTMQLFVDNEQLTAVGCKFSLGSIHILSEHAHTPISNCSHLQGQLCQRHSKVAGLGLIMAPDTAVINVQQSFSHYEPSGSFRWPSSLTWLSLCISQHSCRKWEAGQRPTSFREERKYSALEFKSKTIRGLQRNHLQ